MKRSILCCAVSALVLAGCVSTGKYNALQKQLDQTTQAMQGQIDSRDAQIAKLKKDLATEQDQVKDLDGKIADLTQRMHDQVSALSADKQGLQNQLAEMVKDRSRLKASVQDMRQALSELEARKRQADARVAEFKNLLERFKPLIDTGKLQVKIVDGRMVVQLATDVLFASGSARLSKEGKQAITEVSQVLAQVGDKKFQVEGHTDNVPIHTAAYPSNWELAAARAITVVKTMVDAGMPPARLSAASFAQYEPAQPNDTPEGRAANRRIEIVLLPDLSTLPGFDQLKAIGAGKASAASPASGKATAAAGGAKATPPVPRGH